MADKPFWTDGISGQRSCAVCGAAVSGEFCSDCGQKRLAHRLRFGQLLGDLISRIFNHERGLWHTCRQLLVQPGQVARDYVSGRQKPYVNPLTIFFLGSTAQLLQIWFHGPTLRSMMVQQVNQARAQNPDNAFDRLDKVLGGDAAQGMASAYLDALQQGYTYIALFAFCLPWAVFLAGGHRLTGVRFRLAETTIFALYVFGTILLLTAMLGAFTLRWGISWHFPLAMMIYGLFPLWAHRSFFRPTVFAYAITFLSTVVASGLFFLSIMVVFTLAIGWRVLF